MIQYIGDGRFLEGVPARDLSDEEWAALDAETKDTAQRLGLYRLPTAFRQGDGPTQRPNQRAARAAQDAETAPGPIVPLPGPATGQETPQTGESQPAEGTPTFASGSDASGGGSSGADGGGE